MGRHVIDVDVDKTLTTGGVYWEDDILPNKMVIEYIKKLYYSGNYVIIIWTARLWDSAPELIGWLQKYSVPYHGIMMNKSAADIYIDDKTMLPTEKNLKKLLNNEIDFPTW